MGNGERDYWVTIRFGSLEDFQEKLGAEKKTVSEVMNLMDDRGISLLQQSLISRKFEIADLLLNQGALVNNVSKDGCNELHYIAAHFEDRRAVQLAHRLVKLTVDFDLQDKKYGNSAFFTMCYEAFKVRSNETNELLLSCLELGPDVEIKNNAGYSVKRFIEENGDEDLKKALDSNR